MPGILLLLLASASAADQISDYERQVDDIAKQIKKISRRLNTDQALLKTEREKLLSTEQAIGALTRRLVNSEREINKLQQDIEDLERQASRLQDRTESDRASLAELIRQRFRQRSPNYLKMLLNQENPYAVGRLQNYYAYFIAAQQQKLMAITAQLEALEQVRVTQRQRLDDLQKQKQIRAQQQTELDKAKAARQRSIDTLLAKVDRGEDKLKHLQRDRARLASLIRQLAEQARELQRIEEQQARHQRQTTAAGAASIASPPRPLLAGGFRRQLGRLMPPVEGKQKYRFGSRLMESGMRAEGMFFDTQGSVDVRSIYRGRVLFADFLKGYGLLLIIDHGDDHISLYGHNQLLYRNVGDMVKTNEVVAKSGVSGGLRSPGLYFEIRENATPVDPGKWCQL